MYLIDAISTIFLFAIADTPATHVLPKPIISKVSEAAPKRSLNLEDYKKKRGLI